MSKKNLVSGMRSTGKLHLGHYIGVLTNWVNLQDEYNCFYFVADWHALTTKFDKTENLKQDRFDVVCDWLASGIDPQKSAVYFQSKIPEIAQMHILLSMITPNNRVERDPTLKDTVRMIKSSPDGAKNGMSYGLLGYPVLMSADIATLNGSIVPVGIDQVAHLEITRDIVRRFNYLYKTDYLNEPVPKLTEVPLLKGVDGQKMGKSFNNDIKISDDEQTTEKKIMTAITDRSRLRKSDPGHPEDCEVIFDYYKIFADKETLTCTESDCRAGKIGCADCKRQMAKIINEKFAPIRAKRLEFANNPDYVYDIVNEGNKKARAVASEVLENVKNAVGI